MPNAELDEFIPLSLLPITSRAAARRAACDMLDMFFAAVDMSFCDIKSFKTFGGDDGAKPGLRAEGASGGEETSEPPPSACERVRGLDFCCPAASDGLPRSVFALVFAFGTFFAKAAAKGDLAGSRFDMKSTLLPAFGSFSPSRGYYWAEVNLTVQRPHAKSHGYPDHISHPELAIAVSRHRRSPCHTAT